MLRKVFRAIFLRIRSAQSLHPRKETRSIDCEASQHDRPARMSTPRYKMPADLDLEVVKRTTPA